MTTSVGGSDAVSVCVLRVEQGRYAIETGVIREVLRGIEPQMVPLAPAAIRGLIAYRGEVLSIVSLRALLGLDATEVPGSIVVLEDPLTGEQFGLAVDDAEGVLTVEQRTLQPNPSTLDAHCSKLFRGVYPTPEGLLARLETRRLAPAWIAEQEEDDRQRRTKEC